MRLTNSGTNPYGNISTLIMGDDTKFESVKASLEFLRGLSAGDLISGQVTDVNGGQVTIALGNNQSFTAQVLNEMGYSVGDTVSFEIKDNKGESVILKAVAKELSDFDFSGIDKLLESSGLAINDENRNLVKHMMENNMSLNKDSILQMAKTVAENKNASVEDVLTLVRLNIDVNSENLSALDNLRTYNASFEMGFEALTDALAEYIFENGAEDVLSFLTENNGALNDNQAVDKFQPNEMNEAGTKTSYPSFEAAHLPAKGAQTMDTVQDLSPANEGVNQDEKIKNSQANNISESHAGEISNSKEASVQNKVNTAKDDIELLKELIHSGNIKRFDKPAIKGIIAKIIRDNFSIHESTLRDKAGVKSSIAGNLNKLEELINLSKRSESSASENLSKAASDIKGNTEFMNSLNQFVASAHIPIKFSTDGSDGELYVYKRKAKDFRGNDVLKAFLHLDMEHLGPMDIYVTLKGKSLSTNFVLADESLFDFVEAHMDMLTKSLTDEGYDVKISVGGDEKKGFDFLNEAVMPYLPVNEIKRFSFDVKA